MAMGKKKLMLISAVAVIVILAAGIGFWLLNGDDAKESPQVAATVQESTTSPASVMSAYYVVLPQPFTFNVTGDTRDRVVQIKVQLMVRGDKNEALAKQHIPLIESTLLQAFGVATVEQLRSPNGRDQLRQQALEAVKAAMVKVAGTPAVERVLFTGFVMQ
ncbi:MULTISPECIES: flagellar basal body-associated protein FliL [unclassified Photobacterium]|uniref:flagellar basal body-associated protein FliL n=1 Tax=unclassified Photobacterium TaxID=2628852 RepID=UPI000D16CE06|nr:MULTISPECIES: flagellar basal body-associated protein FliL [unclassified Photobacterium]PSV28765.1 flagellar basal body-associated protein FliL [Photobacterium sp. GB-56]PSV33385.1 flagellar basal body-associated protein FliL [Photobacterium sp. GB-72]PSV39354.1 flagellar basal body-associated protein FliL [Photobacterium sp. GB-27]PSV40655.1 flagellar basal body-associated protein FliL [Photobacterium sp. GB-210]PSV46543.1 flagellar basal body-associated protein FliL [Photobacterium sp. GB